MKKYLILLLFSTFVIGQTTIANKLKIVNATKSNTDTRVLVQDSITKEVHWVLKNSLVSPTPTLQAVVLTGDTSTNKVYLDGGVEINNQDLTVKNEIDDQRVVISKDGIRFFFDFLESQGYLSSEGLTEARNWKLPNIDGTLLSTGGTTTGKPITGDLEFNTNSSPRKLFTALGNVGSSVSLESNSITKIFSYDDNSSTSTQIAVTPNQLFSYSTDNINRGTINVSPDNILLNAGNEETDNLARINLTPDGYIDVKTQDIDGNPTRGLSSSLDYTPNLMPNDYIQKNGVVLRNGTESGYPIKGNLEIKGDGVSMFSLYQNDTVNGFMNSLVFDNDSPFFGLKSKGSLNSQVRMTNGGLDLFTEKESISISTELASLGGKGLTGGEDYTDNITNLDYTQKIYVDKVVSNNIATNATTIVLSSSTLNSTYPTATKGFKVHALSIIAGGMIYEKTATGWCQYATTVTP